MESSLDFRFMVKRKRGKVQLHGEFNFECSSIGFILFFNLLILIILLFPFHCLSEGSIQTFQGLKILNNLIRDL